DRQCRLKTDSGQKLLILGAECSISLRATVDLADPFLAMNERSGKRRGGQRVRLSAGHADRLDDNLPVRVMPNSDANPLHVQPLSHHCREARTNIARVDGALECRAETSQQLIPAQP